ncbi:hypothetical protein ABIE65_000421 [Constrictibacter sp. MBR-5]|jgi:hypothetical protein|uniref:hypothetical protein n=1 Tax=Constrictibacter sp. MBR-5 TaxID=3156467 RepID=UPI00339A72BD
MRSEIYPTQGRPAATAFAPANNHSPLDTSVVLTSARGCMSDEAYHGVVLSAALRSGMTYLRTHAPALAQRLVQPAGRPGVYGGTR